MTVRLPVFRAEFKRRSEPIRRSATPYVHEDAMGELLGKDAETIARDLGLAGRTVRQWRERHDTDHRGPGRTLALAQQSALAHGRPIDQVLAPLRALADVLGYDLAPRVETSAAVDVLLACADVAEVCGSAAAEGVRAARDGRIEPHELAAIETSVPRAVEGLHRFLAEARAAVHNRQETRHA